MISCIPVVVDTVIEVRIVPATGCYVIEVVYEKKSVAQINSKYLAGIDLGIDRLVALATCQAWCETIAC
ncbi:MAG: hypothetical protein F6K54_28585 [Okeania sp. SIO3B5]|uniref:hypothetical protein n=1 Tax=Okeania sp. SIO3B5 TaxID=2607811 RepID=UPI0013FF9034|nr:hypothetical protein [Okeania sp. SIO3B5]NEO56685.1 hypothetical protein [Okeania sp. SIO3B5]